MVLVSGCEEWKSERGVEVGAFHHYMAAGAPNCEEGIMNRNEIEDKIREQLSCELNCRPEDFLKEENVITAGIMHEKRRMFSEKPFFLQMATFGGNAVISADERIIPWLQDWVKDKKGFWLFEQQNFYELDTMLRRYGYKMAPTHHMFIPDPGFMFPESQKR